MTLELEKDVETEGTGLLEYRNVACLNIKADLISVIARNHHPATLWHDL
jgi:hypothetical protein